MQHGTRRRVLTYVQLPLRFNPVLGLVVILTAIAFILFGIIVAALVSVVLGIGQLVLGGAITSQPIAVVFSDRVEIRNLLGLTLETLRIAGLHELHIDGNKLIVPEATGHRMLGGIFS